jgi:hypothetical protein
MHPTPAGLSEKGNAVWPKTFRACDRRKKKIVLRNF